MAVVKIPLTGSLVEELQTLLVRRDHTEQEDHSLLATFSVGLYCGLKMEIRSDEHPPPHFHVLYGNEDASFSIIDCQRLPRVEGLKRYERDIFYWWGNNRRKLALVWNKSRPTDCTVGPVPVPDRMPKLEKRKKRTAPSQSN
jgi:hypothetical protein